MPPGEDNTSGPNAGPTAGTGTADVAAAAVANADAATSGATTGKVASDQLLVTALLSNLVLPGVGYLLVGRHFKGALFIAVILGMFSFGYSLGMGCNFTEQAQERHPVMYVIQWFSGAPAAAGYVMRPDTYPDGAFDNPKLFEIAVLFTCITGLLNLLLFIDLSGMPARDALKRRLAARKETDAQAAAQAATDGSKPEEPATA
ncbi:MAG: DUF6677 family protein [Planctomycetota bacterium]